MHVGILNCIRVLGGYTYSQSIDTVFDTDNFKESEYAASISTTSGNVAISLSWLVLSFYSRLAVDGWT